ASALAPTWDRRCADRGTSPRTASGEAARRRFECRPTRASRPSALLHQVEQVVDVEGRDAFEKSFFIEVLAAPRRRLCFRHGGLLAFGRSARDGGIRRTQRIYKRTNKSAC